MWNIRKNRRLARSQQGTMHQRWGTSFPEIERHYAHPAGMGMTDAMKDATDTHSVGK